MFGGFLLWVAIHGTTIKSFTDIWKEITDAISGQTPSSTTNV